MGNSIELARLKNGRSIAWAAHLLPTTPDTTVAGAIKEIEIEPGSEAESFATNPRLV